MSRISQELINEIREKANIVDIISNYVPLVPRGRNYFGVCPFHDDNHPSMSVNPEKRIYKCFSCGATGTVFKFIMDYENVSFVEAVKKVADTVGISIDIGYVPKKENHSSLHEIYNLSLKFYINNINTAQGKKAKEYLKQRNITQDIIKEFQIGLALNNKDILSKTLAKKFKEEDLLKSGLVAKGNYGYTDLFHDRIMFPLYDLNGQVVAYSGRIYDKTDPSKYYNTRETDIFKKGKLLYNYHRAKPIARQKNQIIVMEGFMDVIRAYTIDVKNVIATMGTAVTSEQANLIKRLAREVILCFDGDAAGAKATMACADELIKIGVTPKVIRLEENLDPDEYIQKYGKERFISKINNPISVMDFKLSYLKQDKNLSTSSDEARYINEVINELEKIDDDILKEVTIKKLVLETNIDENIIRSKLEEKPVVKIQENPKPVVKTTKYEVAQRNLLYYMLKSGDVIEAKVTHLEQFGCFVDIGCGVPSLIPIDAISVSRISHPSDRFHTGQFIKAVVRTNENGRICLTHKELLGTWEENTACFEAGETVSGIVRSVEEYGVFVELSPNLAGLAELRSDVHAGESVSVYIKAIIPEKMKVKLVIVDVCDECIPCHDFSYFCESGHLTNWDYAPAISGKSISTHFE